jgi:hypothetical protein
MLTIKSPEVKQETAPVTEAAVESTTTTVNVEPSTEVVTEEVTTEKPSEVTAVVAAAPVASKPTQKEVAATEEEAPAPSKLQALNRFLDSHPELSEDEAVIIYTSIKSLNPSAMSEREAIIKMQSLNSPELSIEEIEAIVDSEYKLDPDEYSEKEVKAAQARMKRDAARSKQEITRYKESLLNVGSETKENISTAKEVVTESKPTEISETEMARWKSDVSSIAKDMQPIEFEGLEFKFQIPEDQLAQLAEEVSALPIEVLNQYRNDEGQIRVEDAIAERAIIDNIDSIIKYAVEFDRSKRELDIVTKTKNPSFPSVATPKTTDKPQVDRAIESIRNSMKSSSRGLRITS